MHSLLKAAHPSSEGFRYTSNNLIKYNQMILLPIWTFYIGVAIVSLTVSYIATPPNK